MRVDKRTRYSEHAALVRESHALWIQANVSRCCQPLVILVGSSIDLAYYDYRFRSEAHDHVNIIIAVDYRK